MLFSFASIPSCAKSPSSHPPHFEHLDGADLDALGLALALGAVDDRHELAGLGPTFGGCSHQGLRRSHPAARFGQAASKADDDARTRNVLGNAELERGLD